MKYKFKICNRCPKCKGFIHDRAIEFNHSICPLCGQSEVGEQHGLYRRISPFWKFWNIEYEYKWSRTFE